MPAPGFKYTEQKQPVIGRREFKQLARKYGLPARGFWQITKGESGHKPYVQQHDPGDGMVGYGLFQLTPNAWGDGAAKQKFEELGGIEGMKDVENQFKMARFLYKSAGNSFKPWYGTRYLDDRGRAQEGQLGPVQKGASSLGTPGRMQPGKAPRLVPGGETADQKGAMLAALRDPRKSMSLLDRYHSQINSGAYTTSTPASVTPGVKPRYSRGSAPSLNSGGRLARVEAEANKIDRAQVPYLWGGGHQRKIGRNEKVTPMDCSGAVSRLLGLNPMVSGQFAKWGKPGRGKNITIWANNEHVLVEIGGKFWGTSQSNPGGGAGWIDNPGKSYLSRFTPRHPG
jgi:hypothetical protein